MKCVARLTGRVSLLLVSILGGSTHAADNESAPQYRFRGLSIPAATADEPIEAAFSSESAKRYLDLGATLWADQKRCFSCHKHPHTSFRM